MVALGADGGAVAELDEQVAHFTAEENLLEAQSLEHHTNFDLEMMLQIGTCPGIENYSRYVGGREPSERPAYLLDYFPEDFVAS